MIDKQEAVGSFRFIVYRVIYDVCSKFVGLGVRRNNSVSP